MTMETFYTTIIIPFLYNSDCYTAAEHYDFENFSDLFQADLKQTDLWNLDGQRMFQNPDLRIVKTYKLKDKGYQTAGLSSNRNTKYRLHTTPTPFTFQIQNIKLWLFKSGCAFFTLQIFTDQYSANELLFFKKALLDIKRRTPISYSHKKSKTQIITIQTSLKKLLQNLINSLAPFLARIDIYGIHSHAASVTYVLLNDWSHIDKTDYLKKLCLNYTPNVHPIEPLFAYPSPYNYYTWMAEKEKHGFVILGCRKAALEESGPQGSKNLDFLQRLFKDNIFRHYLTLYLYDYSLELQCEYIRYELESGNYHTDMYRKNLLSEMLDNVGQPIKPYTTVPYINQLFTQYIACKVFGLDTYSNQMETYKNSAAISPNDRYDFFISYRRENGGIYLALLISHLLQEKGKKVFLDLNDISYGEEFPQKIKKGIECSSVFLSLLTPGCLDRCTSENDWVYKEISYAFQWGIKCLPVAQDTFKWPTDALPGIKKLQNKNAVIIGHIIDLQRVIDDILTFYDSIDKNPSWCLNN